MGMYHSTYFAYGFEIPGTSADRLDTVLTGTPVGYLHAGDYDRDHTFLVTECTDVQLGDHRKVKPESFTAAEVEAWNANLTKAAALLGVHDGITPGWIVVPDLS